MMLPWSSVACGSKDVAVDDACDLILLASTKTAGEIAVDGAGVVVLSKRACHCAVVWVCLAQNPQCFSRGLGLRCEFGAGFVAAVQRCCRRLCQCFHRSGVREICR